MGDPGQPFATGSVPSVPDERGASGFTPSTVPLGGTGSTIPLTGAASTGAGAGAGGSRWNFLTVSFYKPYFDVDTLDVVERLRDSVFPFPKSHFLEMTALNPDMYGPFWICSTLTFLSAALGNLASYLSFALYSPADATWHYNIRAVSWAAGIFYGYCFVIPLLLFFLLRYLSASAGFIQLWCLYGYSLAIFIPISFLSIVPLEILRWIIVMAGTAVSAFFLGVNLKAQITQGHEMWLPITVGAMLLQAGLGILLKMYFFTTVV